MTDAENMNEEDSRLAAVIIRLPDKPRKTQGFTYFGTDSYQEQ